MTLLNLNHLGITQAEVLGDLKQGPYFAFHPKVVFYNFFPFFFRLCRQQAWEILLTPIRSNWTLYYTLADENHWGVLWHKIDFFDTAAMQERFWQEQCTDGRTIQRLVAKFQKTESVADSHKCHKCHECNKCSRCLQMPTSFIIQHNSWEYSEFMGTPWGIPHKINKLSLTRNWHFENISCEDPPWWP